MPEITFPRRKGPQSYTCQSHESMYNGCTLVSSQLLWTSVRDGFRGVKIARSQFDHDFAPLSRLSVGSANGSDTMLAGDGTEVRRD